jgi:16S rRNA processing protein RimM
MKPKSPPKRRLARAQQLPKYLAAGRVVRPHGVRGDVLADISPDLAGNLGAAATVYLGPTHRQAVIKSFRNHQGRYLVHFEGTSDRPAAEALRGLSVSILSAGTEPLPEGAFFHWQILGLEVYTDPDEHLGKVVRILETGANDVYVVTREDGSEILLPAIASVILDIDLELRRMRVNLIPGLLESQS